MNCTKVESLSSTRIKCESGLKILSLGRILPKSLTGCGLGKILSLYLQWQSRLLGFKLRFTLNINNPVSLKSYASVIAYGIIGELPEGFQLIDVTHIPTTISHLPHRFAVFHKAVGGFTILGDLPNGYTLIEFPPDSLPKSPPKLEVSPQ